MAVARTPVGTTRTAFVQVHARAGRFDSLKQMVEEIARALADHPEGVHVKVVECFQVTVLELRVCLDDIGEVIGRQGRAAKAIRTLLGAAGMKVHRCFTLEILHNSEPSGNSVSHQ
jgi:uncharacterized protein